MIDLANAGNENGTGLDMAVLGGKKYLAVGVSAFFSWSNTRLEIYDVTDPEDCK